MTEDYQRIHRYRYEDYGQVTIEVKDDNKKLLYTVKFTKEEATLVEANKTSPLIYINFPKRFDKEMKPLEMVVCDKSITGKFFVTQVDPNVLKLKESGANKPFVHCYSGHGSGYWAGRSSSDTANESIRFIKSNESEMKSKAIDLNNKNGDLKKKMMLLLQFLNNYSCKCFRKYLRSSTRLSYQLNSISFFLSQLCAHTLSDNGFKSYLDGTLSLEQVETEIINQRSKEKNSIHKAGIENSKSIPPSTKKRFFKWLFG